MTNHTTNDADIRVGEYLAASAHLTAGPHDHRVAALVVAGWKADGFYLLKMNTVADQLGITRMTACKAVKRLIAARLIQRVGTHERGWHIYEPCLQRGDELRTARSERRHDA